MNSVFAVKNNFDHEIVVTSSVGINATIAPGEAMDINFPGDVHQVITVEISAAQVTEPKTVRRLKLAMDLPPPPTTMIIEAVNPAAAEGNG